MALQFNIEAIAKQIEQHIKSSGSQMALPRGKRFIERPARSARKRNDAGDLTVQPFDLEAGRFIRRCIQESTRTEAHQAAIAFGPCSKQHNTRAFRLGIWIARTVIGIAKVHGERTAYDRLDAVPGYFLREF